MALIVQNHAFAALSPAKIVAGIQTLDSSWANCEQLADCHSLSHISGMICDEDVEQVHLLMSLMMLSR